METEKTSTGVVSSTRIQKLSPFDRSTELISYSKKLLNGFDFCINEICEFLIPSSKFKSKQIEIPIFEQKELRIHTGLSPPFLLS